MSNPHSHDPTQVQPVIPQQAPTVDETSAFTPTAGGVPQVPGAPNDPLIGTSIGRYRLLRKLGEGGMGSVYLAEQSEPVKRQVALKLIRGGVDSRTVIARFEAERQALAVMDHPSIARIYDGGTTSTQQPFFVMELVQGVSITDYCDQRRFSPRQRLELFIPICQAVQHAHQKGIIHRDLKPSNVLVTEVDGKAVPKVIDFGVAKATEQPLTDHSIGDTGAIVGTPTYMSPEQADPATPDIDTRTDIYSLGVMLYELLTGTTPIDARLFRRGALLEMLRMVREVDPPRPSTKLSTAKGLPGIAANRNIEPKQLQALLRGDVDWIVMKAIEKERSRRYETANGFAADVERYLTGEAVLAHPPSRWYRVKKLMRRNRVQVISGGLVLAALLAGLAVSLWQMNRAVEAEGLARMNEKNAVAEKDEKEKQRLLAVKLAASEKEAKEQTERRLKQIEKGVELFAGLLIGINPRNEELGGPTLYQQLRSRAEKAADELDAEAVGDSMAVARLQTLLGLALLELGNQQKSIDLLEKARATLMGLVGIEHPDTLNTLTKLATGYLAAGKQSQAVQLFEKVREVREKTIGAEHPETLATLNGLASAYSSVGKLSEAIRLSEQVYAVNKRTLGDEHQDTVIALSNLATSYGAAGKLSEAIGLLEQARADNVARHGAKHPNTLATLNNLAAAYRSAGKLRDAIQLFEEVRIAYVEKLGDEHPDTLTCMNNLALTYKSAGKLEDAIRLYEQVRKARANHLGNEHPSTLTTANNLAVAYEAAEKLTEAVQLLEQVRDARMKLLGADHPSTLATLNNLANVYKKAGRVTDAIPLYEQVRDATARKLGSDHPRMLITLNNLAGAYQSAGKLSKALELYEEAAQGIERKHFLHEQARGIIPNTAMAYEQNNQYEMAESWRRKWIAFVKVKYGAESTAYAGERSDLGLNLIRQKRWPEAESILRESLLIQAKQKQNDWTAFNTQSLLGGALLKQGKHGEAETFLVKGYEGMISRLPKTAPWADAARLAFQVRLNEALDWLIQFYTETNKPDEVKKWQEEKRKIVK